MTAPSANAVVMVALPEGRGSSYHAIKEYGQYPTAQMSECGLWLVDQTAAVPLSRIEAANPKMLCQRPACRKRWPNV